MNHHPVGPLLQQRARSRALRDLNASRLEHGDDIRPANACRCGPLENALKDALMFRLHDGQAVLFIVLFCNSRILQLRQ